MEKILLTPREAAKLTGISINEIHRWCRDKTNGFPSFSRGTNYKIPRAALEKWLEDQAFSRAVI